MALDKFWLIWRPLGGIPTVKHPTLDAALVEAERLARKELDRFYVAESVAQFDANVITEASKEDASGKTVLPPLPAVKG